MDKVYLVIVSDGEYGLENGDVVGVFSTRTLAEEFRAQKHPGDGNIFVRRVDPAPPKETGWRAYRVEFCKDDYDDLLNCEHITPFACEPDPLWFDSWSDSYSRSFRSEYYRFYVEGGHLTEEQALQIAKTRHNKILATNTPLDEGKIDYEKLGIEP